jgi:hypothetical protein
MASPATRCVSVDSLYTGGSGVAMLESPSQQRQELTIAEQAGTPCAGKSAAEPLCRDTCQDGGYCMKVVSRILMLMPALSVAPAMAASSVLWWDSTPEYGSQAPDSLRQEMSDYLSNYGGGTVFDSTYVGSETPGTLAAQLAANSYDVIVFDATSSAAKFNMDDLFAVRAHYETKSNVLLDGNLYVRSIEFGTTTDFPGVNGSTGGLTVNQVNQLATRGGGIMIGTDHDCCQTDANQILDAIIPGAEFSGITTPSTDGVFFGDDMLNDLEAIAAADLLEHWSEIQSQAIAETGMFTDFFERSVTLYSQVDVADTIGGPRNSFISTSWAPGSGTTDVDDETTGGTGGGDDDVVSVPAPTTPALLAIALMSLGFRKRAVPRTRAG